MTKEHLQHELEEKFPQAIRVLEITPDEDEYRSWLVLHEDETVAERDPGRRFCVQGDIRAAFGVGDDFAHVEGQPELHGHYIVEKELATELPRAVLLNIELDSESATFFAYSDSKGDCVQLMEAIDKLAQERA